MADYRGIQTISDALITLFRSSYDPDDFDGHALQFEPYVAENYRQPMARGVSLFLYRVMVNGSHRIPEGRRAPNGRRYQTQLPLDLHYLMTIWAGDASLQHRMVGWLVRLFEDTPILPYGLLNAEAPGVFNPDETVELVPGELSNEDLFRLTEVLMPDGYRLSVPFLVRNVLIESRALQPEGAPVQTRRFDLAQPGEDENTGLHP